MPYGTLRVGKQRLLLRANVFKTMASMAVPRIEAQTVTPARRRTIPVKIVSGCY